MSGISIHVWYGTIVNSHPPTLVQFGPMPGSVGKRRRASIFQVWFSGVRLTLPSFVWFPSLSISPACFLKSRRVQKERLCGSWYDTVVSRGKLCIYDESNFSLCVCVLCLSDVGSRREKDRRHTSRSWKHELAKQSWSFLYPGY